MFQKANRVPIKSGQIAFDAVLDDDDVIVYYDKSYKVIKRLASDFRTDLQRSVAARADFERTAAERAGDWTSLLDFIPRAERENVLNGTTTYDATAVFQKALNTCSSLMLPDRGKVVVSDTLQAKLSNRAIIAQPGFRIESNNPAKAILNLGGLYNKIGGFALSYQNMPAITDTLAAIIQFYGLRFSNLFGLRLEKSYRGMYIVPEEMGAGEGRNFIFSNTFDNIDIRRWRYAALDLEGWNAGNTGCTFTNIYMNNFTWTAEDKHSAPHYVRLNLWSEGKFTQMNCEHGQVTGSAILIGSSVRAFEFDQVHMEGLEAFSGYAGMFRAVGNTNVLIKGWDMYKNKFLNANIGAGSASLLHLGTKSRFYIDGLTQGNGGDSGYDDISLSIALYTGGTTTTGAQIEAKGVEDIDIQVTVVSQPTGIEPILTRWNTWRDKIAAVVANANYSLNPITIVSRIIYSIPLTANRTVTITGCTPVDNHVLEIHRAPTCTGAFNLDVGGLATLSTANTYAKLLYKSGAWILMETK